MSAFAMVQGDSALFTFSALTSVPNSAEVLFVAYAMYADMLICFMYKRITYQQIA